LRGKDKEGEIIPSINSHLFVSNEFCLSSDIKKREVGINLDRLKDLRVKADYYKSWSVAIEAQGTTALKFADKIISNISSLST